MPPKPTARDSDASQPQRGAADEIQIIVNDDAYDIPAGSRLCDLIDRLGLTGRKIAVAHNRRVVPRSHYDSHRLENGDRLEILEAVGGG